MLYDKGFSRSRPLVEHCEPRQRSPFSFDFFPLQWSNLDFLSVMSLWWLSSSTTVSLETYPLLNDMYTLLQSILPNKSVKTRSTLELKLSLTSIAEKQFPSVEFQFLTYSPQRVVWGRAKILLLLLLRLYSQNKWLWFKLREE